MKKSRLNTQDNTENEAPIDPITADSLIEESESQHFNKIDFSRLIVGTLLYFSWFYFLVGLRPEHTFMYVFALALYFAHSKTRQFILAFSIFNVYWIIYDSLRIAPNYTVNRIHIAEIYSLEKSIFGIYTEGGYLTLNEYFKINHTPFLDVLAGFSYLNWVPIPLIFSLYLFYSNKKLLLQFAYAFVFTNILGFLIYYAYPAAPPWYVEQYGFQVIHGTPGNAAGLLNFDAFFGIHLFENMYSKNANVFAAMPSLHSAYPVLCFLYGLRLKKWGLNLFFGTFVLGIWFSAVYTRHHYVLDVLAGGTTALVGYFLFEYLSEKTRLKIWFDWLLMKI
jgi:inositol phosphorylceramide synthase catalytic subunit